MLLDRETESGNGTLTFLGLPVVIASQQMREVVEMAERVARSNASVLIRGESGCGKEVVARAIHQYSARTSKPWVDLNCAALPDHLIESELFGFERGAFSGAATAKPGLFEMAHSGTIFLDEVGELDPRMQAKLLRVLDGAPYFRLGGTRKVTVDVRVVAATNRDLMGAIERGQFRPDLYHRLSQVVLHVPPLRERVADIAPLAGHFLTQHDPRLSFSPGAIALLERHPWPGNIRELRNAVISAAIWAREPRIDIGDFATLNTLPGSGLHLVPLVGAQGAGASTAAHRTPMEGEVTDRRLDSIEKHAIMEALAFTGGHQQRAADRLGISRRTLYRKLKLYRPEGAGCPV